jgi:plasmid stability protein
MAAITLKNVPDRLLSKLRKTAATNRRSLNQHVLSLLSAGTDPEVNATTPREAAPAEAQLEAWRELCGSWKSDDSAKREVGRIYARRSRGRKVNL